MLDNILTLEDGLIHHGKLNDRVYVMRTPKTNIESFIQKIEKLAIQNQYKKIIVKVSNDIKEEFIEKKYDIEAKVPNFYLGVKDCYFVSKYICFSRKDIKNRNAIEDVLKVANLKSGKKYTEGLQEGFICRKVNENDILDVIKLYKKVFLTYPFPIHEEKYIKNTMENNVIYFGIWHNKTLIGLSSSEIDLENKNAEMTDFAVDPKYRGKNIASILLNAMEEEMKKYGILLLYTIARSISYGMNCTFSKNRYNFSGTLINNTNISGNIESMNVWYKEI